MLKGIDPRMPPALLDCLMRMGHGDEIVIADANFPSESTAASTHWGEAIQMTGFDAADVADLICGLMPLDGFSDAAAYRMQIDGAADEMGDVHRDVFAVLEAAKPEGAALSSIERQGFYARAAKAFAVVRTTEAQPFGCFILRKGVIF